MTDRIVEMPYTFKIRGQLRGRRSIIDVPVIDFIPVKVRNVAAEDAPIAFTSNNDHRKYDRCSFRAIGGRPFEILEQPTFLYSTDTPSSMTADALDAVVQKIRAAPRLMWTGYPLQLNLVMQDGTIARERKDLEFKRIESDDHEIRRAEAAAVFEQMLFVDGVAHVPAAEPRWIVDHAGPEWRSVHCRGDISLKRKEPALFQVSFRADRLDDARRFASMFLGPNEAANVMDVVTDHGLIDWRHDDLLESARTLYRYIHHKAGIDQFRELPDACLTAFIEMRSMNRRPGGLAASYIGKFYGAVREFSNGLESEPEAERQVIAPHLLARFEIELQRLDELEHARGLSAGDDEALEVAIGARR